MKHALVWTSISIWVFGCAVEPAKAPAAHQVDSIPRVAAITSGDFSSRLGVIQHTRQGGECLTIADSALRAETPLIFVSAGDTAPPVRGAIGARRTEPCMKPGDEWGTVMLDNASFYDVLLPPGTPEIDRWIAITAEPSALSEAKGVKSIDIDGDGHPETFESCTSNEGLHLIVNTPNVRDTTKRWEAYIYVPYDLEPTCGK